MIENKNFRKSEFNKDKQNIIVRTYNTAKTDIPETHILSNGSYSINDI